MHSAGWRDKLSILTNIIQENSNNPRLKLSIFLTFLLIIQKYNKAKDDKKKMDRVLTRTLGFVFNSPPKHTQKFVRYSVQLGQNRETYRKSASWVKSNAWRKKERGEKKESQC